MAVRYRTYLLQTDRRRDPVGQNVPFCPIGLDFNSIMASAPGDSQLSTPGGRYRNPYLGLDPTLPWNNEKNTRQIDSCIAYMSTSDEKPLSVHMDPSSGLDSNGSS